MNCISVSFPGFATCVKRNSFLLADKTIQPQVYKRASHPLPTAVSAVTLNAIGDLPPKQVFY